MAPAVEVLQLNHLRLKLTGTTRMSPLMHLWRARRLAGRFGPGSSHTCPAHRPPSADTRRPGAGPRQRAGTPKDAIATLNRAIVAGLAAPGMKDRLAMFADVPDEHLFAEEASAAVLAKAIRRRIESGETRID